MLLQDRFCTDVNQAFEGRSVADRATGQRGAILPEGIDYLIEGDARVEVDAEGERRGILALGERTRVSPQIPFNRTDIENAGGFAVEFAMKLRGPEHLRMTHWLGVRAFVDEENRLGDYQAGGQGLLGHFRENGHYSLYSKGVRLPPDSEPRPEFSKQREGWQRLRLEYRMNRLAIDSPVTLVGFANGAREPFVEFTTKTGFEHLHLTLEYRNFNGSKLAGEALVDWLRVSLLNRGMYGQAVP
jgi:hypothetical protein